MSAYKIFAAAVAMAFALAVATALAGFTGKGDDGVNVVAAKGDRLDMVTGTNSCLQNEWPYGCQWRSAEQSQSVRVRASGRGHKPYPRRHAVVITTKRSSNFLKRVF
jgi:hypothetical protein